MITVDLDLGQSDWTEKDWTELDSRMRPKTPKPQKYDLIK